MRVDVPVKLAVFIGGLALVFGGAFAVGAATAGPGAPAVQPPGQPQGGEHETGVPAASGAADSDGATVLPGLAVSERGYALRPQATTLPAGARAPVSFVVTGPDGQPVRGYRMTHEKELHLIVVRRDLSGFQHVHPARGPDGTWSVPLDLSAAGTYRVFADFAPAALGGQTITLGTDLFVPGGFTPEALPARADLSTVDGYQVRVAGAPRASGESELSFTVTRGGAPVSDLQPYLGAFGHLVSLRSGDLAYLHTHPALEAKAGQAGGPEIRFSTTFPTSGSYRLFLDFQHAGKVRTAAFTVEVPAAGRQRPAATTGAPVPEPGPHGH
jgi:hypothetical protein